MPTALVIAEIAIGLSATFSAAWRREETPPSFVAADDPAPRGLAAQEIELGFSARAEHVDLAAFVSFSRGAVDVDEATITTTSLPAGLELTLGLIRSAFGRNNEEHLHEQPFARRPWITSLFGPRGLGGAGARLAIDLPLPWSVELAGEILAANPEFDQAHRLTYVASIENGFAWGETGSIVVGASAASLERAPAPGDGDPPREAVLGIDLFVERGALAFTGELAARRSSVGNDWDGAGYAQLVTRLGPRWVAAARVEFVGLPEAEGLAREDVFTASIGVRVSDAVRVRVTASHERDPSDSARRNETVILQVEGTAGACR